MKADWKEFLIDAGAEPDGDTIRHFGNPGREAKAALGGTVFADLGFLGVIAVHGADATDFLQSQLSNDINAIDENSSQLSAFCTPKGRVLGLTRVFRNDNTWYLRLPLNSLEAVLQRMRMYVLRAQVTLEDASENFVRIGVAGTNSIAEIEATGLPPPTSVNGVTHKGNVTAIQVPGIQPRFEIYVSALDAARGLWDAFNVRAAPTGEPVWRMLDILAGIPNIFAATAELFVPQMINLQLLDGVNFKKGCYPGQEIVARMEYLGTLKRRMYLGRISGEDLAGAGDELYTPVDSEQAVGRIVDAQEHPDGGQVALAVLQIRAAVSGALKLGSVAGADFRLETLPYTFESDSGNS